MEVLAYIYLVSCIVSLFNYWIVHKTFYRIGFVEPETGLSFDEMVRNSVIPILNTIITGAFFITIVNYVLTTFKEILAND